MASVYVVGALKILHVGLAAAWFGSAISTRWTVRPALAVAGGVARAAVSAELVPRQLRLGNILGGLTMLSGVALLYAMTGNLRAEGQWGRYVAAGFLLNLAALYLANFVVRPTNKVVAKLMRKEDPSLPPPAAVVFLQRRMAFSTTLSTLLLSLAIVLMVWADVSRSI